MIQITFQCTKFCMHLFMNFLFLGSFYQILSGMLDPQRLSTTSLNFCHMCVLPSGIPSSCVPGFWPPGVLFFIIHVKFWSWPAWELTFPQSCSGLASSPLTKAWPWPALPSVPSLPPLTKHCFKLNRIAPIEGNTTFILVN